jgi:hypothetical protein
MIRLPGTPELDLDGLLTIDPHADQIWEWTVRLREAVPNLLTAAGWRAAARSRSHMSPRECAHRGDERS